MAAESPRRGSRCGGSIVRPQPVSDKTVMESVVDFFQDVAYSGPTKSDDKEKVQWVRFEQADLNDINHNPDVHITTGNIAPLLLILGYSNGVQIWTIPASGEAQELLSLRQGPIRILRLLPRPDPVYGRQDTFTNKRPLMAICDASSAGQPYCGVKFVSLRSGEEVYNISFNHHAITDIKANDRVVVVAFPDRIAAFDACQFKQTFYIVSCFPAPGPNPNPIALGKRWLAYADRKLVPVHQSGGGMTGDGAQSYAATVISAAKTLTKGLTMFSETVATTLTGKPALVPKKEIGQPTVNGFVPGIVTIIDMLKVADQNSAWPNQQVAGAEFDTNLISVQEDTEGEGLVAHFPAHAGEPVSAMNFDPSGMLLLTADRLGHNFHVFRVLAHPWSCSMGAVHHLYTLHRGDTTAKVQDIAFTEDSRWVSISTLRGTTHVFPITPYGGQINVRTHTSPRVVNRISRFHKSAGLEEMDPSRSGRHSPVHTSGSPGSSPGRHDPHHLRHMLHHNTINNNMGNPRLPPFPHPTTVYPVVQVRQTMAIPGLSAPGAAGAKPKTTGPAPTNANDIMCVVSAFGRTRGWVAGSPNLAREKSDDLPVDSLYILNNHGTLIEHVLDPHAKVGTDKVTEESPLEVTQTARAQWQVGRTQTSAELRPPLPNHHPLIASHEAVVSQKPTAVEAGVTAGLGMRQESRESLSSDHSSTRDDPDNQWLSQVEIITHAGPHRRLWMGPQFSFKTFQGSATTTVLASNSSVLLSQSPDHQVSTMDIVADDLDLHSLKIQPARSSPVAMPGVESRRTNRHSSGSDCCQSPAAGALLIEAGSYEQSTTLLDAYPSWPETSVPVESGEVAEERLRERLADAMNEAPMKEGGPASKHVDVDPGSMETLSSSSGSGYSSSRSRGASFDARPEPPHSIEHVLVFPGSNGSPDESS